MSCPTNITQLQTNLRRQAYYCSSRDTTTTDAETASNLETFLNNQVEKFPNPNSTLVEIYKQIVEKIKERISNTLNAAQTQIPIFKGNTDKLSVFSWLDTLINGRASKPVISISSL
jgi:anti-sigma28 factor (negative regulator of flagellin synthesis)